MWLQGQCCFPCCLPNCLSFCQTPDTVLCCVHRLFLRKLRDTLRIPVLALVDSDPYGLKILSVYMKGESFRNSSSCKLRRIAALCTAQSEHFALRMTGSMNMSYDSSNLTTPDIKWLGVRPSDLDRFNIPQQCRLPMTDEDIRTGKRLVGSNFDPISACMIFADASMLQFCHVPDEWGGNPASTCACSWRRSSSRQTLSG